MFEEPIFEEPQRDEHHPIETSPTLEQIVEGWDLPAGAYLTDTIRRGLLAALSTGIDDPQAIADVAIGPVVIALGRMEVDLADARSRIDELERALRQRDGGD